MKIPGELPLVPKHEQLPIFPTLRWRLVSEPPALVKTYVFDDKELRDTFLIDALALERASERDAQLHVDGLEATFTLITRGVNMVTELDRRFARDLDSIYKSTTFGD